MKPSLTQSTGNSNKFKEISESEVPASFKKAASNTGDRRYQGFQRSEVKNIRANTSTKAVDHNGEPLTTDIGFDNYDQTNQAQPASMDAFRAKSNSAQLSPATVNAPKSENSSLEIVTHTSEKQSSVEQELTSDQKPSCWSRAAAAEDISTGWDSSSHDVERLGPKTLSASLNTLPKYRPKNGSKVNLGSTESSFARQLARSAVHDGSPNSGQTKAAGKSRLRTEANFPALQSSQQTKPEQHANPQAPHLTTPNTLTSKGSKKADATATLDRTIDEVDDTKAKSNVTTEYAINKTVDTKSDVKAPVAPHLRPKTNIKNAGANTEVNDNKTPPHLRSPLNKSATGAAKPNNTEEGKKMESNNEQMPATQPPRLQASTVLTPKSTNSAKRPPHLSKPTIPVYQPPHLQASAALASKVANAAPAKAQQKLQKHAISPDVKLPQQASQDGAPATPEFWGDIETSDCGSAAKSQKTAASPCGILPHQSGSKTVAASKNTSAKKEGAFTWITEAVDSPLAGWDGNWQPAPVGDEWARRDQHDPNGTRRLFGVEHWATDQAQDQVVNPVAIDVNSREFLTGEGLAGGDDGLQEAIEASLHSAPPARSTVNEAKRLLTAEDAIKERIARG